MSPPAYEPVPTSASDATYPPSRPRHARPSYPHPFRALLTLFGGGGGTQESLDARLGPPYAMEPKTYLNPIVILKYLGGTVFGLVIFHYVLLGAFPDSSYGAKFSGVDDAAAAAAGAASYAAAAATVGQVLGQLDPSAGQPGTFFRDSYPFRTMLAFWDLAEKEVAARGLDTCKGQLGRELVDAYHSSEVAYCVPPNDGTERTDVFVPTTIRNDSHSPHWDGSEPVPESSIYCSPVHRSTFSKWWPYPAAPCVASNLRVIPGDDRKFVAVGCDVGADGQRLNVEMGRERYLGSDTIKIKADDDGAICEERIERTLLVIGRQDQWNPFHVAEDLITTLVSSFIAMRTAPALVETRVQLVFVEGYGMDTNHFTPLWDRMGAWAPRRLSLDPWTKGTCLTNTVHSVGAGASLLSAMGVGKSYSCASTITWAASHYYRHLFGLLPTSLSLPENLLGSHHTAARPRRPINVLWLSRAKLDSYAKEHNDWSNWRNVRHITNEPELLKRLRTGLASLCDGTSASSDFGPAGCVFEDAQDFPESWASTSPDSITSDDEPLPLRFATIDPTVHALETQIHFVGHSTILVSSHGGALGLSLFLPPGDGTILELQVENVAGNYHFQHMAMEMGHNYEVLRIEQNVDVEQIWEAVGRWVWKVAKSG